MPAQWTCVVDNDSGRTRDYARLVIEDSVAGLWRAAGEKPRKAVGWQHCAALFVFEAEVELIGGRFDDFGGEL